MQEYYTYAYLDPTRPVRLELPNVCLLFEPFYIGKGTGDRMNVQMQKGSRVHNHAFKNRIEKLRRMNPDWPIRIKLESFQSSDSAYDAEEALIRAIGSNYIAGISDGPLTNLSIGAKPRSQKGRSYAEIYGSEEKALQQIEKRRATQNARGGYRTGIPHDSNTKEKIGATTKRLQANGGFRKGIPHDEATKQKISEASKLLVGNKSLIIVERESEEIYAVFRFGPFCKEKGIKQVTLDTNFRKKRGAAKSGLCKGWMVVSKEPIPKGTEPIFRRYMEMGLTHVSLSDYLKALEDHHIVCQK